MLEILILETFLMKRPKIKGILFPLVYSAQIDYFIFETYSKMAR